MKSFIQIFFTALVCLGIFSIVLYSGCTNKCGSTACQNGGTCSNNKCICPTGYSGNACQTAWSSQFIGTYDCTRSCTPAIAGTNSWASPVVKDATNGGYTVDIEYFNGSSATQVATVDSLGNLSITPPAGSSGVSGTGKYSATGNGVITIKYTTYDITGGAGKYGCNITMTKR